MDCLRQEISLYGRGVFTFLLALFLFGNCKKKAEPSLSDPQWQEESLQLAGELCSKIKNCAIQTNSLTQFNAAEWKLLEKRFTESNCKEYHKKTKIYNLETDNPQELKSLARACYHKMLTMECESLQKKEYQNFMECKKLKMITNKKNELLQ